jgi:Putative Actinobacterial Holin-X, holin superfamily III
MAYEHLKNAALPRAISEVLADVTDLVQKEIRLARAEISQKLATKIQGGVWMAAAGVLAFVAFILLLQAVVHGIASYGIALHWSYLIVAVVIAIGAGLAFAKGRSDVGAELTPERAVRNVQNDISVAKEHLT